MELHGRRMTSLHCHGQWRRGSVRRCCAKWEVSEAESAVVVEKLKEVRGLEEDGVLNEEKPPAGEGEVGAPGGSRPTDIRKLCASARDLVQKCSS